jgi:capsule polysaccharide export protein KpsE/RkpR
LVSPSHLLPGLPISPGAAGAVAPPWLGLLWRRRVVLGRALALGLALSLLVAFLMGERYDSTIRLMPPDNQSGSALAMMSSLAGKSGLGAAALPQGLLGLRSSGALFVDILGGRTVQDRMIGRFDLRRVYGERYESEARRRLQNWTEISEDRKSGVLTIRVTDRDPRRAALMAQAYVEELDRLVAEVSTSSARRERIFIENRLQAVRQDLDRASRDFSQFASRNLTMDLTSQGRAALEAAARLQGEMIAAQSELEGLEQVYTPSNVRVRSQRARVEEFRRQLDRLDGDRPAIGSPSAAAEGAPASEETGSAFPSLRQLPLLGVRWAELYRQTKMEETVYELLTQQYELAKIEEAKEIPTVKVLDMADIPEKKSWPPRTLVTALGTLLMVSLGALGVLGWGAWEQTDPEDPRKRLALHALDWGQERLGGWVRRVRTVGRGVGP